MSSSIGIIWLLLVSFFLSLSHYETEGRGMMSISISQEDDLELERQLKILNKPPIKTFQTEYDIFDCVDINNQPALDHHSLKNHKIQTAPTSLPKQLIDGTSSVEKHPTVMLNSIDCPQGTVPIRRTRKEDLIRAKAFSKSFSTKIHPETTNSPGQHQAILRSIDAFNLTYYGIYSYIDVYNVTLAVDQSSSGQMWIENGPSDQRNSLQAGWMVAPHLFGDGLTRLFAYWTADGGKTGCYNTLCSGFVQVDRNHALGDILTPTSTYDGPQFIMHLLVFQDNVSGNWWLTFGDNINLGYWPKSLLPHLVGGASYVGWGGEVKGPSNEPSPPMGSGHLPAFDFYKACYFCQIEIVNASNYRISPNEHQVEAYADSPQRHCYQLDYFGYLNEDMGHAVLFGGPGGDCGP